MLDTVTKNRINTARDILVGKVPDPKSQVEQITIALIYKFMDDMDVESEELGGKRTFFVNVYSKYSWRKIFDPRFSGYELLNLYSEAIAKMDTNPAVPKLFRDIFKNAYLPYRDPETLKSFLKIINEFEYTHSEKLGDAFEYLLSVLGSQGDAGQFRTPRHIIDFMVAIMDPQKHETILDPACGTAGFLISSYRHIIKHNSSNYNPEEDHKVAGAEGKGVNEVIINSNGYSGDLLSAGDRTRLADNIYGYDISPDMVRLSLVNMYLHGIKEPHISEYDTLTSEDNWNHFSDVILANPPFMSPKGGIRPHKRFSVQSNRSEVLFVDYIAEHLTANGRAAVIVPEGVIFQSGNAYKQLRKMLVEEYLVGVISLPAGVFQPYSGVKTSVLWIDKSLAKRSGTILFAKVDNDGFDLGAQRRAIAKNDLPETLQIVRRHYDYIEKGIVYEQSEKILVVERKDILQTSEFGLNGEKYRKHNKILSSFPLYKIGDVCELINGRAFKPSDWETESSGGLPIIRIQNLNDPTATFNYYSGDVGRYLISTGDLLFSWSGSRGTSFGAHIWFGGKAILNQHIFNVKFNSSKVTKQYLYYILNKAVETVEKNLHGGVGLVHITKADLEKIEIPVPSLLEQEQIVFELDSCRKIIDGARMVVENYKPRIEIDPAWEIVMLGEVCENHDYKRRPVEKSNRKLGPYPYYGASGIVDYVDSYLFDGEYLLLSEDGANLLARSTPIAFSITGKTWVNNHAHILSFNSRITQRFIEIYLNQTDLKLFITGMAQPKLNQSAMNRIPIPLPDIEKQKEIVEKIEIEMQAIKANLTLIELYEKKIKDRIIKVWGE